MIVTHLTLTDFRNYPSLEIGFTPGPNLIIGSNGQGKTNLVESLGYLSTLGSHRVSTEHAMIRQGQTSAIIRARLLSGDREILAEVQLNRAGVNRAQVNRSAVRTRDLPRYFSSVLFAPEDLALVRNEPSVRRKFLDELLVSLTPRLSSVMVDYDRVVRQRNTLLKSARTIRGEVSTLDIWDERLIELGSQIVVARCALVKELNPLVETAYEEIAGAGHAATLASHLSIFSDSAEGGPQALDESSNGEGISEVTGGFRAALARRRRSERERGVTLTGPHRDDMVLGLNGLAARGYASHGESWSFALALKLASAAVLKRESSLGDPVLILDDVFAELDESRRKRLADSVAGFEQVLITAAVLNDVPKRLIGSTIRIAAGAVVIDHG